MGVMGLCDQSPSFLQNRLFFRNIDCEIIYQRKW